MYLLYWPILLLNPLRSSTKGCSDWAENFRVALFTYLKNILFYALIFYLALLKVISDLVNLIFGFFYSALGQKHFLQTGFVTLAPYP